MALLNFFSTFIPDSNNFRLTIFDWVELQVLIFSYSPPGCWRSPTNGRRQPISNGRDTFDHRYLYHNCKPMKALHTTNSRNANHSHQRIRSVMTLTGIVTVMLCFVALLQEPRSVERIDARVPRLLESTQIVAAGLVAEVKTWL